MIIEVLFNFFVKILAGYLLADFIMGVYHWIKDTYFSPFTPVIGKKLVWGSRLHHIRPRYVCEFDDWSLFFDSAKWTLIWMGPLFLYTGITAFMLSLFITISLNDVIHKYAHMFDNERPKWITFLQKIYVLQTYDEHHLHHIEPHNVNYCPITPYINIILEKTNFWGVSECLIERATGVKARDFIDEFVEDPAYPCGVKFLNNY
jgi:hypothetical protein